MYTPSHHSIHLRNATFIVTASHCFVYHTSNNCSQHHEKSPKNNRIMDQSIHRRTIPKCILIGILIVSSSAFNAVDTVRQFSRHYSTALFYQDSADLYKESTTDQKTSKVSDFKLRMRSIVKQRQSTGRKSTSAWRPQNFRTAVSLQEYFNVIEEGRRSKRTVVVKFHATWCKVSELLLRDLFRSFTFRLIILTGSFIRNVNPSGQFF